jgi:hypothetical protein
MRRARSSDESSIILVQRCRWKLVACDVRVLCVKENAQCLYFEADELSFSWDVRYVNALAIHIALVKIRRTHRDIG